MQTSQRPTGLARGLWSVVLLSLLCACASSPDRPEHLNDLCAIFLQQDQWYEQALRAQTKWHIAVPLMMAIMHQESRFEAEARPPRTTCLWVLPGPRPSSAYGYAQASDDTWDTYRRDTGNRWADRDDFGDAVDFVGWYCDRSVKRCGIARDDPYHLYLAYHEGHGGFNRRTYRAKGWLLSVARRVEQRARLYAAQLPGCEKELRDTGRSCLWPF